jgi:hypothetical protein
MKRMDGTAVALTVLNDAGSTFFVHRRGVFPVVSSTGSGDDGDGGSTVMVTVRVSPVPNVVRDCHVRSLTDPRARVIAMRHVPRQTDALQVIQALAAAAGDREAEFQWNERDVREGVWTRARVVAVSHDSVTVRCVGAGADSNSSSSLSIMKLPVMNVRAPEDVVSAHGAVLVTLITTAKGAAAHELEISYASSGMRWHATYAAVLSEDGKSIELDGHYVVSNSCGNDWLAVQLSLCCPREPRSSSSSSLLRHHGHREHEKTGSVRLLSTMKTSGKMETFSVPTPVDLPDGSDVQVLFCSTLHVSMAHRYRPYSEEQEPFREINLDRNFVTSAERTVDCILQFTNPVDVPVPQAFPVGPLEVMYRTSSTGLGIQHFGSFSIPFTKPGETVDIFMGQSNKVYGDRKRVDIRLDRKAHVLSEMFAVQIKNRTKEDDQ